MRDTTTTAGLASLALSIADKKNADLNSLMGLVTEAQYDVAEKQAIVNSLQAKAQQFIGYLALADDDKETALANLHMGKDALSSASSLDASIQTATDKAGSAQTGASAASDQMAELVHKLILSIEYINKVSQLVNKQKANNPLVPDKLIDNMSKSATAANNAVALSLTALQSCYVAEATLLESSNAYVAAKKESSALLTQMSSLWSPKSSSVIDPTADVAGSHHLGILALLQQAYDTAKTRYEQALLNNSIVTEQVAYAQAQLDKANVELNSYKAGLAAATAAAYAA